ncbi:S1 RNA-binding domain-containing protein [bacterium]|nr:S1 RNA-binding domain-containing protein [bacterium]
MPVEIGEIYEGTVVKLLKYGAIVRLPDGTSGLVHISEIADAFVHDVADYVQEGESLRVKVTGEKEGGRLEMSAKQAEPLSPREGTPSAAAANRPRPRPVPQEFEERLGDFIRSSNQRLNELQRSRNVRRRGGRK